MNKETRFVWCVVFVFAVVAFALHKNGNYDRGDNDRATHESPPPPPPPPPPSATCVAGFDYGMFTNGDQHYEANTSTDSYASASGPYAAGGCNGNVGTNATDGNAVKLEANVTNCGTITTGTGGTVNTGSHDTYTTPAIANPTPVGFVAVTVPTPALPAGGSGNYTDGSLHALTPNETYTTWDCSGHGTVLSLSAGSYVVGDIHLDHQCVIQVSAGPVIVYFSADIHAESNTSINAPSNTGVPTDLVFMGTGAGGQVHLESNTSMYAGIYAPNTSIHFEAHTDFYGAAVGKDYHGESNSNLHYDTSMSAIDLGTAACPSSELARSSPIVASVGSATGQPLAYPQTAIVQGTFSRPLSASPTTITALGDVAAWSYPYYTGHMRARLASSIDTTETAFTAGTIIFDAATAIPPVVTTGCPPPYNGTCRGVFTTTTTPTAATGVAFHPTQTPVQDGNAATIGPFIVSNVTIPSIDTGNYYRDILRKVLNGALGGVDRSTVAVIGPSSLAGNPLRPTIAYFGGLDGMLHAVCASTGGTTATHASPVCPTPTVTGTELWAFLPRSQLPRLVWNTQRIDGSIRVVDVFGDFTSAAANGTRSWHTILTFQTGAQTSTLKAATYALDITDPATPVVLWEYATPVAPASLDVGAGLTMAAGQTLINGSLKNLAVIETNNGGTGGTGVVTTAVQLENGTQLWQKGYAYPTPPRGIVADLPLPATGIVGGGVGVDLVGAGYMTDVVFGDLYGDIWRLNIADGTSRDGTNAPLFSASTNKHPFGVAPTIYKDGTTGNQFGLFTSGGYDDPVATSWSDNTTQYLISANLGYSGGTVSELTAACATRSCAMSINTTLTSGDKGFAQALVVGNQVFLTTDSNDVNSSGYGASGTSGHLTAINLLTMAITTTATTTSGAGSLANNGSTLYGSAGTSQTQIATATGTSGQSVDTSSVPKITRNLWLRTQ